MTDQIMKLVELIGFAETGTGGGCTALCAFDSANREYLITDGNLSAPENPSDPCVLSVSDPEGYSIKAADCANLADAVFLADSWRKEFAADDEEDHFAKNEFRR